MSMQEKPVRGRGIFGWVAGLYGRREKRKEEEHQNIQVDSSGSTDLHAENPATTGGSSALKSPLVYDGSSGDQPKPTILNGHSASLLSLAFSPSGQLLASGSFGNTIRLWNAEAGVNVATLKGHSAQVRSVAFSPDGTILASSSWDNTIILWDVESRAQITTFREHQEVTYSVTFSRDGAWLASGSGDKTIRLWDIRSRSRITILKGHSAQVRSVAFSPDGRRIASGCQDSTNRLWDIATGTTLAVLNGHSGPVISAAISPSGEYLASGSDDSTVRLWDAATGASFATMEGHLGEVHSIAFSQRYLASGSYDATVRLWDVKSKSHVSTLRSDSDSGHVYCVAFSPNGSRLACGSQDKTIRIWEVPLGGEASGKDSEELTHDAAASSDPQSTVSTSDLAGLTQSTTNSGYGVVASDLPLIPLNNDITGFVSRGGVIGYGGFGDIFSGNHMDGRRVVLKKPRMMFDEASIRRFLREVDLWCSVSHQFVLPCLGMCRIGFDVYVVSPFIENGDLLSCIKRGTDLDFSKLLFEVAEALTHLHHRGIIHGDVKAQNILIANDRSALLCDFGLAKAFDTMATSTDAKGAGSVRWMAPELFLGESRSMASDVYSLGITIAEVLSGRMPYHDMMDNIAVMYHVLHSDGRPPKEPLSSREGQSYAMLWETAEKCWAKEVNTRPYMAEVIAMLFPLTRKSV